MIDERALEVAIKQLGIGLVFARSVITAYEAALWRPIEEAPLDGTEILAEFAEDSPFPGKHIVIYDIGGIWVDTYGEDVHSSQLGAMFRTINPPQKK